MNTPVLTSATPVDRFHPEVAKWVNGGDVIADSWSETAGNLVVVVRRETESYAIIRAWRRALNPSAVCVSVDADDATSEETIKYLLQIR